MMMGEGCVVILSGVSSIGKDRVKELLLKDPELGLMEIISLTTRPKRADEKDGLDYYFVDHRNFAAAAREHRLLEYTEFNGYYYGTPAEHAEFLMAMGKNVLICVEAQGVGQIRIKHPDNMAFFLVPTSMAELEKQVRQRYKDDLSGIALRLNKAQTELELAEMFGVCVTLTSDEEAYQTIRTALIGKLNERR